MGAGFLTAAVSPPPHDAPRPARPRRVALVISSLSGGGAERVTSALAKYWSAAGHDVTLVTLARRETDLYPVAPGVDRVALDLLAPSRNQIEAAAGASRRVLALRRTFARLRPDVVVSMMSATNVLALLATIGTPTPVLVCERSDPRYEPVGAPWSALRRALYPLAAGVVLQTESAAAWARAFCRRVHVVPNFVERPPRPATPDAAKGPWQLLAMGRLVPEKGFDILIEAFARVERDHPEWSLAILGEGPERGRLEALACARRLAARVRFPGRVSDPLPHLLSAHAFALSSRFEGFPNALLEAMACGLPAVAFDCPSGPSEVVVHGHNGLLVPPGDVAGLGAALARLMSRPSYRARLGARARDVASVLSPERVLESWSALLSGVARKGAL